MGDNEGKMGCISCVVMTWIPFLLGMVLYCIAGQLFTKEK